MKNGGRPALGILEWLRPGEEERVERLLLDLKTIGVSELRTGISWADWHTEGGEKWYDWLLPRLAGELNVLPCFHYTPPCLGIAPSECSPPRNPKQYADFLDVFISRFGEFFEWVELWNKPRSPLEWNTTLDPHWLIFCEMVGGAAHWARQRGKKTVLGASGPMERVYWYSAHDLPPSQISDENKFYSDEREHHFGLRRSDGSEKLLFRLLAHDGIDAVENSAWLGRSNVASRTGKRPVVITGGCGFIGCNLAHALCSNEQPVILYDNLSRPGVEQNAEWLRETHGDLVQLEVADTRDAQTLAECVEQAAAVYHFAAQVAVTNSLTAPVYDFDVNARATLNLLEAVRELRKPPPIIFTSTNKVYGSLEDIDLRLNGERYEPVDDEIRACGVGEDQRLDFYSPYGCSKGAADQYILDYARTFGLPAVVFRMSCIFGPHQFGTEDQGWVAHFLINALEQRPITIYGDGKQVRDILFVNDLVDALLLARKNLRILSGQVFNIGGGVENTTSLRELLALIGQLNESKPRVKFAHWRPGDQRYYVTNFSRFHTATGWSPRVGKLKGVRRLHDWLRESRVTRERLVSTG